MPSQSPGKESSGGDVESVIPDSSSLQDDVTATGNWQSSSSVMNPSFQPVGLFKKKKNRNLQSV